MAAKLSAASFSETRVSTSLARQVAMCICQQMPSFADVTILPSSFDSSRACFAAFVACRPTPPALSENGRRDPRPRPSSSWTTWPPPCRDVVDVPMRHISRGAV